MKERPILFSAPMVRAILAGTKTQTRRVVKLRNGQYMPPSKEADINGWRQMLRNCPYGQPGDRLWVRETWNWFDPEAIPNSRRGKRADFTGQQGDRQIEWCAAYAADGSLAYPGYGGRDHWRPSIHMPRWASRITLEITGVRVERLQDISEADAVAEGVCELPLQAAEPGCWWTADVGAGAALHGRTPSNAYRLLWESINDPKSWDANPWVWVVDFKRLEGGAA